MEFTISHNAGDFSVDIPAGENAEFSFVLPAEVSDLAARKFAGAKPKVVVTVVWNGAALDKVNWNQVSEKVNWNM
jgi:hypothetical protein